MPLDCLSCRNKWIDFLALLSKLLWYLVIAVKISKSTYDYQNSLADKRLSVEVTMDPLLFGHFFLRIEECNIALNSY